LKFLLPVDGSSSSRRAGTFASELLDPENDSITIFCVVEGVPISESEEDTDSTSIRSRITEEAELVSEEASNRLKEFGFDVSTEIAYGNAGEEICKQADELNVDGIILGRQGKGQVEEILLGSVSRYVIRHASVPVITVPSSVE
jgi:nucleotide-binding universal stress UspA family protein